MRVGMGYDVHRLVEGRKLILGGVEIPYEKGLLGHSDADVLIHAIMDALLGAAALGDIGKHFPDTDPEYKGISSVELLRRVGHLLEENHYVIENIDATVIAQKPKLRPYMDEMKNKLCEALEIEENQLNLKATTEEGLGFTGSGEGMAAQAICMLIPLLDLAGDGPDHQRMRRMLWLWTIKESGNWTEGNMTGQENCMKPCFRRTASCLWIIIMTRWQMKMRFMW